MVAIVLSSLLLSLLLLFVFVVKAHFALCILWL